MKVFNESGKGYWMEGFGCIRAEGENRPSRPGHIVCFRTDAVLIMEKRDKDVRCAAFMGGQAPDVVYEVKDG